MFLKTFSILAITGLTIANAATTANVMQDSYAMLELGDELKPLNLRLKANAVADVGNEFEAFCVAEKTKSEKVAEFKIVRTFSESLFSMNGGGPMHASTGTNVSFSTIENWVSNPVNNYSSPGMPVTSTERVLIVDLKLLALRSPKPVTEQQITEYLATAKNEAKTYLSYQLLKQFARGVHGVQLNDVDQLDQWFLENHNGCEPGPHMHGNSVPKLKCELKRVQDLISAKADRNIIAEFDNFEKNNSKLLERAQLFDNLQKFVNLQGNPQSLDMLIPSMAFKDEELFENGRMIQRRTLLQDFEFISFLEQAKKKSLQSMLSDLEKDASLRAYGNFVLRSQSCGVEIYQNNQQLQERLCSESQVEFRNGLVFQAGKPLTTSNTTWAMNHEGEMRIFPLTLGTPCNHSMFFQKNYIGLPVACAGHIELNGGKIAKISNSSGHYMPTFLNLVMAVAHLHEKGVMVENIKFDGIYGYNNGTSLSEFLRIARAIELA